MASHSDRLWQIDALRGLMLVLMTLTHLPTRYASPLGQPFGYVSAAEGFVLLSGFMAGLVYTKRQQREGDPGVRGAFLGRALKIYLCQAALLAFLFSAVALLGLALRQDAVLNLLTYFLENPLTAFVSSLALIYNPPLLDILPMYVLFLLASPVLLLHGLHRGWGGILAGSIALWVGAQFGLDEALYDALAGAAGVPVPFAQTGAFDILGWQLLWVIGLWLGADRAAPRAAPLVFPRWMVRLALALALIGFVWRHAVGQAPFFGVPELEILFDKWQLAPLRLFNLFALLVLAVHYAPWLAQRLPRVPVLEQMGAASLPVFCAHLVLALLTLALFGEPGPQRGWAMDSAILALAFVVLAAVARASSERDRRAALSARPARPPAGLAAAAADAPR